VNILITNDDGIFAPGLWVLVRELKENSDIIVVAPDREQSGIGTGITLHHPLRIQKIQSLIPDVPAYAVCGTPGDSVIIGLNHLSDKKIDLVISGINAGPNVGVDVFLSGTVGAALQGYLHNVSSIAVSLNDTGTQWTETAARIVGKLVFRILESVPRGGEKPFLNINIPACDIVDMKGIVVTSLGFNRLAEEVEEGHDGRHLYYWIKHRKAETSVQDMTDVWAINNNYISITPLHSSLFSKTAPEFNGNIRLDIQELVREL